MTDAPPDAVADDQLVSRAVAGDADALADLLALLGPRVRDRLRIDPALRAVLEPDDVMQVTYLEAFLRIGTLRTVTTGGFVAWLTRVARNNLRDAVKHLRRARRPDPHRQLQPRPLEDSCTDLLDSLGCSSVTASRDAVTREAVERLRAALERLPDSYRLVVERCDLQGEDAASVGALMGRSAGAVHMLRARAHDRLRDLLGPASRLLPPAP